MSSIAQISYNVVIDRLRAFATGHQMINSFSHGQISLVDLPKDKEYPAMHVVPGQVLLDRGQRQFTFDVVFFDKPRSKEDESDYQKEVISDCVRLAEDLLYEIKVGNVLFGKDVDVQYNNTIDPFMEGFAQVVTGVTLSGIQITVQNGWNACDIPATYSPGAGSGSGGSGSGAGGIVFKVNSTNNTIQNVLNLVNGTNITITDLGDGRVRISATGGGGGGADWGSIGGDIDDQTDLISRLDAIIASVSNEATARASADTTLQTNINNEATARTNADNALQSDIDQVAADLATETTARQAGDATNATDLTNHVNNTSNPHSTTKAQVGLSNVDNTSDADKPISTATQTALNAKEPTITAGTTSQYYRGDKTFQTLDKSAVGLSNVDNTSDANKPVSTAQATAIAAKQDTLVSGTNIKTINGNSLLGSGNLAISAVVNQAYRTFSTSLTLAASSGDRWYVMQNGLSSGTEGAVQSSAEFAMTFTEIRVRTFSAQSGTGTLVFTLRKNGVDQFSLTIAAGAAAGVYTATGSFSVVAGDLINWKIRNNATVTSANIAQLSVVYQ
jgi:hypothetical protein